MSLHELLLGDPYVLHRISEEISADLLFLLHHFHDKLLIFTILTCSLDFSSFLQQFRLLLSEALSRVFHDNLEDILVVGESKKAVGFALGLTESLDLC
jgi:hypothetical protein